VLRPRPPRLASPRPQRQSPNHHLPGGQFFALPASSQASFLASVVDSFFSSSVTVTDGDSISSNTFTTSLPATAPVRSIYTILGYQLQLSQHQPRRPCPEPRRRLSGILHCRSRGLQTSRSRHLPISKLQSIRCPNTVPPPVLPSSYVHPWSPLPPRLKLQFPLQSPHDHGFHFLFHCHLLCYLLLTLLILILHRRPSSKLCLHIPVTALCFHLILFLFLGTCR